MEGFIKIESACRGKDQGVSIETDLKDVTYVDRVVILKGVCQALHINSAELKLMAEFIDSGLLEALMDADQITSETEVRKPKKRPKVQVLSCDPEDLPDLLKELIGEDGDDE